MSQKSQLSAVSILGALFAFFVLNALWTNLWGYPTLYCLARWAVKPLVAPWHHLVLPSLTVGLLYVLFTGAGWRAVGTVFFLMVVWSAGPDWLDMIGGWGKSCV